MTIKGENRTNVPAAYLPLNCRAPGRRAMSALLQVEGLRVDIPTPMGMLHAVRGVDLALEAGETLCLVGESGCGKSLSALALMGLLPRAARRSVARFDFAGEDLQRAGERAHGRSARQPHGDDLPGADDLAQSVLVDRQPARGGLAAPSRREPGRSARERALHLLERVGITGAASRLGQYPHQLSGGLRQRVMIAMALMCEPALMIADEPTTALDVTVQAQILHLLKELQREFGMGLILITHDLGIVARVADRVAVMYAGEIVEQGAGGAPVRPAARIRTRAACSTASRCRGGSRRASAWARSPAW